jgi:NitT/TauT family transport system substrate-binding protein
MSLMKAAALAATLALGLAAATPAAAQTRVTFLLNWAPQGDHSPYYWAQAQGWYRQAGIELTIEAGRGSVPTIQRVAAGQVPLGIADMANVLQARATQNVDATAVMAIYANTPFGFYWKKSGGIRDPKDFAGRKLGAPAGDAARPMWPAIARAIGIPANSITWVNIAPEAKVASLQSGVIDATPHFYSVHDVYLRTFGDDLGYVGLRQLGVNPYGLSLIANGAYLRANADTVRRFLSVSQRAFAECLRTPEPCAKTLADATSQDVADVLANWNRVRELVVNETGRTVALGAFDPARMAADAKLIEEVFGVKIADVGAAFSNAFLDPAVRLP